METKIRQNAEIDVSERTVVGESYPSEPILAVLQTWRLRPGKESGARTRTQVSTDTPHPP